MAGYTIDRFPRRLYSTDPDVQKRLDEAADKRSDRQRDEAVTMQARVSRLRAREAEQAAER